MLSIRFRLIALFVLMVTMALAAFGIYGQVRLSHELEQRFADRQKEALVRLKTSLPTALWSYDKAQTERIIQAELEPKEVVSVVVFDAKSKPIASAKRDDATLADTGAPHSSVQAPLYIEQATQKMPPTGAADAPIGTVTVTYTRSFVEADLRSALIGRLIEILLLDALLMALLTVSLNMVFRPIARLRDALFDLAAQDNDDVKELPEAAQQEFREVIQGFNLTQRKLRQVIARIALAEESARLAATETQAAYRVLQSTQESLVQSEKLAGLGGLVAGVAHEINTPISIVVTAASLLDVATTQLRKSMALGAIRKSDVSSYLDTAGESMRLILTNSERAAQLIQSFKQVAADQASEQRRHFKLGAYLRELITSLYPSLRQAQSSVQLHCALEVEMDSYPGLMGQVLTNLTMNAITHAFAAGTAGHIDITVHCCDDIVSLAFSDDGRGIPAEHLGKIFDPFFTTRRGQGGTGLGLHIVFNIVTNQLGGTIAAQNNPSKGVCFYLSFPRVTPNAKDG